MPWIGEEKTQTARVLSPGQQALLAQTLTGQQNFTEDRIPRRPVDKPIPLSHAQQRLWLISQFKPGDTTYNLSGAVPIHFAVDLIVLRRTVSELVRRHESLRTTFPVQQGLPSQVISPPADVEIPLIDLSALGRARREEEVARRIAAEAARSFDLAKGPLLRTVLLTLAKTEHLLLISTHHIVSDGWSMTILVRELELIYASLARGQNAELPELPVQYADFAMWQRGALRGDAFDRQVDYWRQHLAGISQLELPTDRLRPRVPTGRGERLPLRFSADQRSGIDTLSSRLGVTPFMTLLAGFAALLSRYSGQSDIVIGVPVAGRNRGELEGLIGLFVNSLVFRADVSGDASFSDLLSQVRNTAVDALANQDVPFDLIVDELNPRRDLNRNPLYQVTFQYMTFPLHTTAAASHTNGTPTSEARHGGVIFDLSLDLWPSADGFEGRFDYTTDLFEASTIQRMAKHYDNLLRAAIANPSMPLSRLQILSEEERQQILDEWVPGPRNSTIAEVCVHRQFEAQVERTPGAIALSCGAASLTYQELNVRANHLARRLRHGGVSPETITAVCVERSPELVIALFAVLKAGGAYVPIDPEYPRDRIAYMIDDSQARVVLTLERLRAALPLDNRQIVCLDLNDQPLHEPDQDENLEGGASLGNLAYLIYTSGSTGKPKGVAIEHRALANHMGWMQGRFPLTPEDRVLQRTAFSFDASVWEFYAPLLVGASLVLASPERHQDGADLVRQVMANQITVIQMVPTLFQLFADEPDLQACHSLRRVFCGGEVLLPETGRRFAQRHPAELVNLYGPTEVTIDCVAHVYSDEVDGSAVSVPIGRPIDNVCAYVVDGDRCLLPPGIAGELWLGGAGLARGYWRNSQLEAERFIQDPFLSGNRLYRSGDRVRWLADGSLQYLGRIETGQVKIRGQRIELGEVEAAILSYPQVSSCATAMKDGKLFAYIVARQGERASAVAEVRQYLRQVLPEAAIPTALVGLDFLPLTPGGKLDRGALPAPERATLELSQEYEPPSSDAERVLAQIWADLLKLHEIGVRDNFFELGGDSILSVQVIARANEAGLRLSPKDIFEHQTVAELAVAGGASDLHLAAAAASAYVPLTPIQHWFFEQPRKSTECFVRSVNLTLSVPLDTHTLEHALAQLMRQHSSLCLSFERRDGDLVQQRLTIPASSVLERIDLGTVPQSDREGAIAAAVAKSQRSLSRIHGPRFRVLLFDAGPDLEMRISFLIHCLLADSRSCHILANELRQLCDTAAQSSLPPAPAPSYLERWARQSKEAAQTRLVQEEMPYWSYVVSETSPLPSGAAADAVGAKSVASVDRYLDSAETSQVLSELPAIYRCSLEDLLVTALARTLALWAGQPRIGLFWRRDARERTVTSAVGWIENIVPLSLTLDKDLSLPSALKSVKEQLRSMPRDGAGYGLLRWLCPDKERLHNLKAAAGSMVYFCHEGAPDILSAAEIEPFVCSPVNPDPFEIITQLHNGKFRLTWRFDARYMATATVTELADRFFAELRAFSTASAQADAACTPSDFACARISKPDLTSLLARLGKQRKPASMAVGGQEER